MSAGTCLDNHKVTCSSLLLVLLTLPVSTVNAQVSAGSDNTVGNVGNVDRIERIERIDTMILQDPRSPAQAEQPLILPVIRIERANNQQELQGLYGEPTTDVNLGVEYSPVKGLSLRADAWSIEDRQAPLQNGTTGIAWQSGVSGSLLEPGTGGSVAGHNSFNLDQPYLGSDLESRGIDLGASYIWETDKAGRFTLKTTATYIQEFDQRNELSETLGFLEEESRLPGSPDLQGSLTLTWEFGNHTASAVTNYFDSFKDISELNIDEINELVEDITTVDLQYGYNVTTGKQDRAVISFSFGIRNIFDRKTTQILNQNSRVVDQNGRVAYGSIKYQF